MQEKTQKERQKKEGGRFSIKAEFVYGLIHEYAAHANMLAKKTIPANVERHRCLPRFLS